MIVAGELVAGAKLNEESIAEMLGVSRGPVREAFRALEQAGLVRTEKNRGVFVRQVSLEEANEIYEVRAALDGLIGRLAAQRIEPAQLARLRDIVQRMQVARPRAQRRCVFPAEPRIPRRARRSGGQPRAGVQLPADRQRTQPLPTRDARPQRREHPDLDQGPRGDRRRRRAGDARARRAAAASSTCSTVASACTRALASRPAPLAMSARAHAHPARLRKGTDAR